MEHKSIMFISNEDYELRDKILNSMYIFNLEYMDENDVEISFEDSIEFMSIIVERYFKNNMHKIKTLWHLCEFLIGFCSLFTYGKYIKANHILAHCKFNTRKFDKNIPFYFIENHDERSIDLYFHDDYSFNLTSIMENPTRNNHNEFISDIYNICLSNTKKYRKEIKNKLIKNYKNEWIKIKKLDWNFRERDNDDRNLYIIIFESSKFKYTKNDKINLYLYLRRIEFYF